MGNYYADKLNADKMMRVYDTQIPRIVQYLSAEIDYIKGFLDRTKTVMEFGAGYGRILKELAPHAKAVAGFDISAASVAAGQDYLKDHPNATLFQADVHRLEHEAVYDIVLCVQNALSAMKGAAAQTVEKAVSMLSPGGTALFSTYSPSFWAYRLAWFQEQADKGLLGPLDFEKSIHGQIVCQDGFTATTHSREELEGFALKLGYPYAITEVDRSSLFLAITKGKAKEHP